MKGDARLSAARNASQHEAGARMENIKYRNHVYIIKREVLLSEITRKPETWLLAGKTYPCGACKARRPKRPILNLHNLA